LIALVGEGLRTDAGQGIDQADDVSSAHLVNRLREAQASPASADLLDRSAAARAFRAACVSYSSKAAHRPGDRSR
jgi:hypothetical protein